MAYIDGFLIPVETARKQDFIDHANQIDALFLEEGALHGPCQECGALGGLFPVPQQIEHGGAELFIIDRQRGPTTLVKRAEAI